MLLGPHVCEYSKGGRCYQNECCPKINHDRVYAIRVEQAIGLVSRILVIVCTYIRVHILSVRWITPHWDGILYEKIKVRIDVYVTPGNFLA